MISDDTITKAAAKIGLKEQLYWEDKAGWVFDAEETIPKIEALRTERDRLREALTSIAKMKGTYGYVGTYSAGAFANEIARATMAKATEGGRGR
jgi:hypothetical protein